MNIASVSYAQVTDLVASKSLAITFIFGPPRGGTTAAERWMYDSFNFDGNVNQPGLMARDEVGDRERIEATWSTVLKKYNEIRKKKADGETIRLIVKETSNVVLPESELSLWQKVSQCVLLVYRNPILQIESRICCILNRISSGATIDLGVTPDLDPRTATIGGYPLIKPDSDFTCIDDTKQNEISLWEQFYKHMKKTRDYTCLDYGFIIYSTLHPLFEEPQIQKECLSLYRKNQKDLNHMNNNLCNDNTNRDNVFNINDNDLLKVIGSTKLEDICILSKIHNKNISSFFYSAFHAWRFGWIEFYEQVHVLFNNINKPGYCSNIGLIDMSDLQSSPKYFFDKLKPLVGYKPTTQIKNDIMDKNNEVQVEGESQVSNELKIYKEVSEPLPGDKAACDQTYDKQSSNDSTLTSTSTTSTSTSTSTSNKKATAADGFDVSSQGADWDMWFLSSCNWDTIDSTSEIRPPTKSIVKYGSFPSFLMEEIDFGLQVFCELKSFKFLNSSSSIDNGINFQVPVQTLRKFYGVDIIQDYINEALFFNQSSSSSDNDSLDNIPARIQANSNDFGYLLLIKKSLIHCGVTLPEHVLDEELSLKLATTSVIGSPMTQRYNSNQSNI